MARTACSSLALALGRSLFSKPKRKNYRLILFVVTSTRAPPLLPRPGSATRFFTTLPPRSASTRPSLISETASQSAASVSCVLRIQRLKWRVLKTRDADEYITGCTGSESSSAAWVSGCSACLGRNVARRRGRGPGGRELRPPLQSRDGGGSGREPGRGVALAAAHASTAKQPANPDQDLAPEENQSVA